MNYHTQRCEIGRYVGPDFVFVHGHYQCPRCKQIGDGDCCQGETCDPPPNPVRPLDYADLKDEDVPN